MKSDSPTKKTTTPSLFSRVIVLCLFLIFAVSINDAYAVSGPSSPPTNAASLHEPSATNYTKKEKRQLLRNLKTQSRAMARTVDRQSSSGVAGSDGFGVNGFAIAGFVCGLVGLLSPGGLILGILGIVFSAIGLARIKKGRGGNLGRGLAIAGLVLGILALLVDVNV